MSSQSSQRKRKLSRAEVKAYEARRAAEQQRIAMIEEGRDITSTTVDVRGGTSYVMTRDEEWGVIRTDLIRLAIIVVILLVLLAIATILLR